MSSLWVVAGCVLAAEKFSIPLATSVKCIGVPWRLSVVGEIARVLDAHVRRLLPAPFAERILPTRFEMRSQRVMTSSGRFFTPLFEVLCEQLQKLVFRREAVCFRAITERSERLLHLLGELFIDVPARLEIGVFAAEIKMMPDSQKKDNVIVVALVLGDFAEYCLFGEYAAESGQRTFEVFECRRVRFVCVGSRTVERP